MSESGLTKELKVQLRVHKCTNNQTINSDGEEE
jgi:hypothetical protein